MKLIIHTQIIQFEDDFVPSSEQQAIYALARLADEEFKTEWARLKAREVELAVEEDKKSS